MNYIACPTPLSIEFSRQEDWEWIAISSSKGSCPPRDQTCVSSIGRQILYQYTTWEAPTPISKSLSIYLNHYYKNWLMLLWRLQSPTACCLQAGDPEEGWRCNSICVQGLGNWGGRLCGFQSGSEGLRTKSAEGRRGTAQLQQSDRKDHIFPPFTSLYSGPRRFG